MKKQSEYYETPLWIIGQAFENVYSKPLPWHRFLFYSFESNKKWYNKKFREEIERLKNN